MNGLSPISTDFGTIWIDQLTHKLMVSDEDGVDKELFNVNNSKVIDIIEKSGVPISTEVLNSWLSIYNYGGVLNQYVLDDTRLLTIGSDGSIYGIAISGSTGIKRIACLIDDDRWSRLESLVTNLIESLTLESERISDMLNSVDSSQEYIQLVRKTSLTDYVSFRHLVKPTGGYNYIFVTSHEIYYDSNRVYRSYENNPYGDKLDPELKKLIEIDPVQPLQYDLYKKTPIYERIVKEGDIIDLSIAYKSDLLTIDDIINSGNSLLYGTHLNSNGRVQLNVISSLITVTNTSTGVPNEVMPSRIKIGNDILVEVTTDNLVIYSTNPHINEYFIKSCRLIKNR